jgi:hypothetical protein
VTAAQHEGRPTLDEIRSWPPTVSPGQAGQAFGKSTRAIYRAIAADEFPVETIRMSGRIHVLTASLLRVLEGSGPR